MERHAIVTGTSRGVGAAVARELLARGWTVTGVARGAAPADLARGYEHVRLDLSRLAEAAEWFEGNFRFEDAAGARLGLVNNAGTIRPVRAALRLPAQELERSLVLNAAAPLWLTGFVLRRAVKASVRVVDVSSGAATSAYPGWSAYCAGKAALRMAGEVVALELEEVPDLQGRDAALVSYAPHVVETAMQAEIRAADPADFPRRKRFEDLDAGGGLVPAEGPAREIADLLEAEDLPPWSERRFQP